MKGLCGVDLELGSAVVLDTTAVECTVGEVNEAMECGDTDDGLGEMETAAAAVELCNVAEDFSGNIQE